ncbi:putative immunity protein [Nakamurella sp. GG22]
MERQMSALTMDEDNRGLLAQWASDCAERVLPLFESEHPDDPRPRAAIDGARAWSRGEIDARAAQLLALEAQEAARLADNRAARSAARAAGQACGVAQLGGHARHAAAYAVAAIAQSVPDDHAAMDRELQWQRDHLALEAHPLVFRRSDRDAERTGSDG